MTKRKRGDEDEESEARLSNKKGKPFDLSIHQIKTSKDKIKQPELAELDIIPRINSSILFVGASGSGKSTVLANLMTRKEMLGKAFDRVFLFSPTAKTDDIQKSLNIDDDDIEDDLSKVPDMLEEMMEDQRDLIEELGANHAPKYAIIFDDVIGNKDFTKHSTFTDCFILNRHFNFTTFICSQSYKEIPRRCRLQAKNIIYFAGSNSENEAIMEDRCPPNYSRKDGLRLVQFATKDEYSFLHINMRSHFTDRYRRNFDEIIEVECGDDEGDCSTDDEEEVEDKVVEEIRQAGDEDSHNSK